MHVESCRIMIYNQIAFITLRPTRELTILNKLVYLYNHLLHNVSGANCIDPDKTAPSGEDGADLHWPKT